jgi:hypothetical protein
MMMISWWSKYVGVILSVLKIDIWINVLLQTSALVGPLHIENIIYLIWCVNFEFVMLNQAHCRVFKK